VKTANIRITSVGLATAQGGVSEILADNSLRAPGGLLWSPDKWTLCRRAFSAHGIDPSLTGTARWSALARRALDDCYAGDTPRAGTPLLLASCNGAASAFHEDLWQHAYDSTELLRGTIWANQKLPVFSASCSSGLQALYIAKQMLLAGRASEITVLAVDVLSHANHSNFEVLRVLADDPAPWQSTNSGFILGEAAVAVRLACTEAEDAPLLGGPTLGSRVPRVLSSLCCTDPELVIGQGTGPFGSDERELADLREHVPAAAALTTPLGHFGHTLGASSLLAIALAALTLRSGSPVRSLHMRSSTASDGRPLFQNHANPSNILVSSRALSGACAAAATGMRLPAEESALLAQWGEVSETGPLMHPVLRRVAGEALQHRPESPPDLLVVQLDAPLLPQQRARIGERLLPSAVLEMTPGFVSQLVARCWSFTGGAVCLVGRPDTHSTTEEMLKGCEASGLRLFRMWLRGDDDERTIEWEF
jgi:hypothetical protein